MTKNDHVSRCGRRCGASGWLRRAALSALLGCFAAPVCAQAGGPLMLNWVRGEGAERCVSGRELEAALQRTLEADQIAPAALTIEGIVQRDVARAVWRARLRVIDSEEVTVGMRELSSAEPSCEALTPSIVLVLAILVELRSTPAPAKAEAPPAAASVPAPTGEPAPTPGPAPTVEPAVRGEPAQPPRGWQVEPLAAISLMLGLVPGPSVGAQAGARLRTPWPFSIALRGGYWPGGSAPVSDPAGEAAHVDFRAYHGDLSACLSLPRADALWLAGCWGVAVGARHAQPVGLIDAAASRRVYAAATAAVQVGYAVTRRLWLSFEAGFLGFGRDDRYLYRAADGTQHELFDPGRFAGSFALGIGVLL